MKKILALCILGLSGLLLADSVVIFGPASRIQATAQQAGEEEESWPCPVPKTGFTNSYADYDDGWYSTNSGTAWPDPRFTIGANTNVVLDNGTGLIWARDANLYGTNEWTNAVTFCENLDYGGYTDWRLPNIRELQTLTDYSQSGPALPVDYPFANLQYNNKRYWSSSPRGSSPGNQVIRIDYNEGLHATDSKAPTAGNYTWPVRGPD